MAQFDIITGSIRLPLSHPFCRQFNPDVREMGGKWRVRWRDFGGVSQDQEFDTYAEARVFADELTDDRQIVHFEGGLFQGQTFDDLDTFWKATSP